MGVLLVPGPADLGISLVEPLGHGFVVPLLEIVVEHVVEGLFELFGGAVEVRGVLVVRRPCLTLAARFLSESACFIFSLMMVITFF